MQDKFSGYTEKEVLADALSAQKTQTGMFNAMSNECANPNVRKVMLDILNDEHSIQFDVFNDMHQRGYYPTAPAQQDKVNQTKTKFAQCANKQDSTSTNTGEWHTKMDDPLHPHPKM